MVGSHFVEEETLKKNIALYYGMVNLMDKYIGKILDKLYDLGLDKNTIIVYTTEHGHLFRQHGLTQKGPFLYEDLIKVPFIVRYPNRVPANCINSAMQSLVDMHLHFLILLVEKYQEL